MELENIPGYRRAMERGQEFECTLRENAFLDLPLYIAGVQVRQLTLRLLVTLFRVQSPFLVGRRRKTAGDVAAFLWCVSPFFQPLYQPGAQAARAVFLESIVGVSFRPACRQIDRYIYFACLDRPPSHRRRGTLNPPETSFPSVAIHRLAKAYGWTVDQILDLKMAVIYQLLREIDSDADPKRPQFHPICSRLTRRIRQRVLQEAQPC